MAPRCRLRAITDLTLFRADSARGKPYIPNNRFDTAMEKCRRQIRISGFLLSCLFFFAASSAGGQAGTMQSLLDSAFSGTTAVVVVLDGKNGHLLAAEHAEEAAKITSAPGSVLKPLFLNTALKQGLIRSDSTVFCRRNLRIANRNLSCTHPIEANVLNAESALAYSCNSYFANLARRFSQDQAVAVLHEYGFGSRTGLFTAESAGTLGRPANEQDLQLLVLGLQDVEVTPAQLARAYFKLAENITADSVVMRGLQGSVEYGMAHGAATKGLSIAGKTGTASDANQPWTHGWFVGIASRRRESIILAVYIPRGNGADAALLAHRFLAKWREAD
jgi:cell division protein FtsI/penicillin-binding protein 2